MNFQQLGVNFKIVDTLKKTGIEEATDIQVRTIPQILKNRDIIACSKTGTGKTLAYLLPMLTMLDPEIKGIQFLILAPTQELCSQINNNIRTLLDRADLRNESALLVGDGNISRQIESLKRKPAFAVGTSARVMQLIKMKKIHLNNVKVFCLDEADEMLSKTQMENVINIRHSLMRRTQTLLFSASIQKRTIKDASAITNDPVIINLVAEDKSGQAIPNTIKHFYFSCNRNEKIETLRKVVKALDCDRVMVFVNSKYEYQETCQKLKYHRYEIASIAGNETKQEKIAAIDNFKTGKVKILISTDLAARGLQIDAIDAVIHLNLPSENEIYIHRAGRCGRNGKQGLSISLVTENETEKIKKLRKSLGINMLEKKLYNGKIVSK